MLTIQNITYLQGGEPLLHNASLQVFANQRVGLVGHNGCGKSTLFRLIRGQIHVDGGEVSLQSGKTLAYVEQEIENSERAALEFVALKKYSPARNTMPLGMRRSKALKRLMVMARQRARRNY